ncbi:MAG TPA: hypothetical protein VGB44_11195 [Flavobacterium sp.]|jgi:hypothetical protein
MKQLITLIFIALSATMNAQDFQEYLKETDALIKNGKYQEALERHIWFHDHALDKDNSMQGVRLSFALGDWKELADLYPPALKALTDIRDKKTAEILNTGGTKELFADVNGINKTLGEGGKTATLFEYTFLNKPQLAKMYWYYVKDELFALKRYDLIGKFIGNPMTEYSVLEEHYNRDIELSKTIKINGAMLKSYSENTFVEKSIQLIHFAIASNDLKTAKEIQKAALKVVNDYRLRDAIAG